MTYQEMVEALAAMDEQTRKGQIQHHWQAVFSDGFIAYVQGQLEAARSYHQGHPAYDQVFQTLDPSLVDILVDQMAKQEKRLAAVWSSMVAVYEVLQQRSEQQGASGGMVSHGRHRSMPRGVNVPAAAHCFRCGSPATHQGLCGGCFDTQRDWEQEDLDYQRQQVAQQEYDLEYQRVQETQTYYDTQMDFNAYTDYSSGYDR